MDIIGYENYQIYSDGRVYSKNNRIFLKPIINSDGYYVICLSNEGVTKTIRIHRLVAIYYITNNLNLQEIDHIDRNKLNNDISNLRWCNRGQNNRNKKVSNTTSKYTGVYWNKNKNKWHVQLKINGKNKHIGYYINEDDAALAYNNYIIENIKEYPDLSFCNLNVIPIKQPKKVITITKKIEIF